MTEKQADDLIRTVNSLHESMNILNTNFEKFKAVQEFRCDAATARREDHERILRDEKAGLLSRTQALEERTGLLYKMVGGILAFITGVFGTWLGGWMKFK